jgi:hypothetical protein
MIRKTLALVAIALLAALTDARAEAFRTAVFDFELINTSTGLDPTETERARLAMLSDRLREALDASTYFDVVSIEPVAEEAAHSKLQACGACDRRFAESIGADLSVTGVINKVSELVLSIRIFVRNVGTGEIVAAFTADIRGNDDRSWTRGLDWLLKHRILPKDSAP